MDNNIFNMNRFGRYFKTDVINGAMNYGISLLVLAAMPVALEVFSGIYGLLFSGQWGTAGQMARILMFCLFLIVIITTAPSKMYGSLTDKKEGTQFVMLPVSAFEKFLSMILCSCIIVPVLFVLIYFSLDWLITVLDPDAGLSLVAMAGDLSDKLTGLLSEIQENSANDILFDPRGLVNPWLYIDDFIIWPLTFLLGAIWFKKSKIAKTIGCYVAISMILGLIITPLMTRGINFDPETIGQIENMDHAMIQQMFPGPFWVFNHLTLIDTISDSIWIIAVLWGIWYRVKNLKH